MKIIVLLFLFFNQIYEFFPKSKTYHSFNFGPLFGRTLTYVPGIGSEVRVNGLVKDIVLGEDFAKAFFAIWVGANPVDAKAKLQLLGG